jgi:hypothetical protein
MSDKGIAHALGVSDKTIAKALRCLQVVHRDDPHRGTRVHGRGWALTGHAALLPVVLPGMCCTT